MALSSSSKENISLKKLVGKSHTSNAQEAFNETKTTGLTLSTTSIFGETIPPAPSSESLHSISGSVEYVRLTATPLQESSINGRFHAFKLSLPAQYEANSSNEKSGTAPFTNSTDLHSSTGSLQLVPPNFSSSYEAKVYYGSPDVNGNFPVAQRIFLLDERSWYLDYFSGILFQETPPGSADLDPTFVEAYIYIGDMANQKISSAASTGGSNGSSNLDGLEDVTIGVAGLAENQVLVYTSSNVFENQVLSSSQLSDGSSLITTGSSIADLNDVNTLAGIADGNVLAWVTANNRFEFTAPAQTYTDEMARNAAGTALAGGNGNHTGISFSNNDVSNTIEATVSLASTDLTDSSLLARLVDPNFTGTPTATNPVAGDNTTSIATTAFVQGELSSYQPLDAALTSISGLTTSANQIIYTTASDAYAVSTLTSFARDLLDDVNAEAMRNTLGLGSASLLDSNAFLSTSAVIDNLSDVSITNIQNAQILVYDDDSGEADDKWKNVSISGDITISNTGVATITSGSISNEMITNSFIDITAGGSTDRLNLGETFTIVGVNNQIEVSNTIDAAGETEGSTLTIGLPDDVTIVGDLTVSGDLTINGDATSIVTTNLDVTDSVISLNNGIIGNDPVNNPVANPSTRDIGFFFDRGSLDPALIFWDEADDVFKLGTNSGNINSTASDLGDANFAYSVLKIASPKDAQDNLDLTSNDNTAATTEWTASKISAIVINDLSDVDTTGVAEGKILKFDENNQLVIAEPNGFVADTASLWDIDPNDSNNIFPHGIIDGTLDTGLFAINLSASDVNLASNNTTLEDIVAAIQNINAYTYTTRTDAEDTYWEFVDPDNDNYDIQPKDY